MSQSESYKYINEINYLSDLVGADLARDLLNVGITASDIALDVSAQRVPTSPDGRAFKTGSPELAANGTESASLSAIGSTMLVGYASRSEAFSVVVKWETTDGTLITKTKPVSGQTGEQTFEIPMATPYATVEFQDTSGNAADVVYALHTTSGAVGGSEAATLSSLESKAATESTLSSLESTDFATQSTLSTLESKAAFSDRSNPRVDTISRSSGWTRRGAQWFDPRASQLELQEVRGRTSTFRRARRTATSWSRIRRQRNRAQTTRRTWLDPMSEGKEDITEWQFEIESRERLATMEAQHDSLEEKVDSLADGQDEILDHLNKLNQKYVDDEEFGEISGQVSKNSRARRRATTLTKLFLMVMAFGGSLTGLAVVFI